MRRALVASVLGIAASVAESYGQASFFFNTYLAIPFSMATSPIRWSSFMPGGLAGTAVDDTYGFVADIVWSYGTTTGDAGLAVPLSSIPVYGSGWIVGPVVSTSDNWVSNQNITFTIEVWSGGTGYGQGNIANGSLTWVELASTFFAGGPPVPFDSYPGGLTVPALIPEPGTLSLAGLGAAAVLITRRRNLATAMVPCRQGGEF